ncbi:MAG: dUTP diphosphatase [Chlamydiia bacterium]|nr:dUTP diphosphatase [Chlamydiia bacterium]
MEISNFINIDSLNDKSGLVVGIQIEEGARLPIYKTSGSSGADICAFEKKVIKKGKIAVIRTGVSLEIPEGYESQVRSRSGLSLKGIFVLNSPGTIDSDYRGEINIILANMGDEDFIVEKGFRIAQLVFSRVSIVKFNQNQVLSITSRGEGRFGHTGISS